ncbi:MAG: phage holin family protein [Candidatus Nanopelagicales bacterium]
MLISAAIRLLANAIGLLVAAAVLPDMTIDGVSFVIAVVIFTVIEVILDPLVTKMAVEKAPALRGGVALITTLIGLILTTLISSGLQINGFSTWLAATVIVWIAAVLAGLILPVIFVKNKVDERASN